MAPRDMAHRGARLFPGDEILTVLSCDVAGRPAAPGPDAILPMVRSVDRREGHTIVDLEPSGRAVVAKFVEAERVCCVGIDWQVEEVAGSLRLSIGAAPGQLDLIEGLFSAPEPRDLATRG